MFLRGILALILTFSLPAHANQDELSPEVMDLIHNTVGMGKFTMHRDDFNEMINQKLNTELEVYAFEARTESCYEAMKQMVAMGRAKDTSICDTKEEGYVTISRVREFVGELDFSGGRTLAKEMDSINQLGQGLVALMYAMPGDFTGWDKSEPLTFQNWGEKKTSLPVFDEDPWYINFVGHPVAGGISTVAALQAGATRLEAFGFSVFMSTFIWEYGNEAIIETPSIQDLVITPVVGFFFGLAMYSLNKRIEANDGKWMGSQFMGNIGLFITDPSGQFQKGLDKMSKGRIQDFRMGFRTLEMPNMYEDGSPFAEQQLIGFGFEFKFGAKPSKRRRR